MSYQYRATFEGKYVLVGLARQWMKGQIITISEQLCMFSGLFGSAVRGPKKQTSLFISLKCGRRSSRLAQVAIAMTCSFFPRNVLVYYYEL